MTTSAPLTPAEQAAAVALADWHNAESLTHTYSSMAFAAEARAVVAAVRDLIAVEVLNHAADRLVDQAERVRTKSGRNQPSGHNRVYGLSEAASMLRADSRSLSRPTSGENR